MCVCVCVWVCVCLERCLVAGARERQKLSYSATGSSFSSQTPSRPPPLGGTCMRSFTDGTAGRLAFFPSPKAQAMCRSPEKVNPLLLPTHARTRPRRTDTVRQTCLGKRLRETPADEIPRQRRPGHVLSLVTFRSHVSFSRGPLISREPANASFCT